MKEAAILNATVRDDFVPAGDYVSGEFARRERERLWPRAWQFVGREQELTAPGDFVTYEIADESITVVRTPQAKLKGFYNVCPHRGRKLTKGCGRMGRFHCKYHGWKWDLDGRSVDVIDRGDWGDALDDADIALQTVRVATWAGWVFVCMDPAAPELMEWLDPAPSFLDVFEIEKMRYKWRRQAVLPANWKVALEAFTEGYHVQTTHRQILAWSSDYTVSAPQGLHGHFGYAPGRPLGMPSPRLGEPGDVDVREGIIQFYEEMLETLDTTMTEHTLRAARRLRDEMKADDQPIDVLRAFLKFNREEHENSGAGWPAGLTPEKMSAAGTSWHLFPNMVFLQGAAQLLGYRARPNGDDPDSCIFDVYALERYPEGTEPPTPEVQILPDIASVEDWGLVLTQDFQNMADIQQGMKSRGFRGARTNPKQELAISNFHRALHEFLA